jgi:hypothetical protein
MVSGNQMGRHLGQVSKTNNISENNHKVLPINTSWKLCKSTFPLPYILQFLATYTCFTFSVPILSIMIKLSISIKVLLHQANYQLIH